MNKILSKINFKDKKVYIPLIVIAILILILCMFGIAKLVNILSSKENKYTASTVQEVEFIDKLGTDSNRKSITLKSSNTNSKCYNDICVTNVKVLCYDNRGVVEFTVTNNSSSKKDGGYLKLTIGSYSAVIWHDEVDSGSSVDGFHSYEGYDLKSSSTYSVSGLDDDDKSTIVSFTYYENILPRVYYTLDYEGNRIYHIGDEDIKAVPCMDYFKIPVVSQCDSKDDKVVKEEDPNDAEKTIEKRYDCNNKLIDDNRNLLDENGNIIYETETDDNGNVTFKQKLDETAIYISIDPNSKNEDSDEGGPLPMCSEYDDVKLTIVG